jgi:hypothetical protein
MSIYAALSAWAYKSQQELEAEQAVLEYITWLQGAATAPLCVSDVLRVPRGTRELFLKQRPGTTIAVQSFLDFIAGGSGKVVPRRQGRSLSIERQRLISALRKMEQKQRRELISMLYWRYHYLHEADVAMREFWGRR